jgi:hypothetical protein
MRRFFDRGQTVKTGRGDDETRLSLLPLWEKVPERSEGG